jgi:hypothetical protein
LSDSLLSVQEEGSIWQRRQEMLLLASGSGLGNGNVKRLAEKWGVSEKAIYQDWERQSDWRSRLLDVTNIERYTEDEVCKFKALVSECWVAVQEVRERGGLSALNGAMKNLRESLVAEQEFLQSIGCLPMVPREVNVNQKSASVEVKLDERDIDSLRRIRIAAARQDIGKEQSSGLH